MHEERILRMERRALAALEAGHPSLVHASDVLALVNELRDLQFDRAQAKIAGMMQVASGRAEVQP